MHHLLAHLLFILGICQPIYAMEVTQEIADLQSLDWYEFCSTQHEPVIIGVVQLLSLKDQIVFLKTVRGDSRFHNASWVHVLLENKQQDLFENLFKVKPDPFIKELDYYTHELIDCGVQVNIDAYCLFLIKKLENSSIEEFHHLYLSLDVDNWGYNYFSDGQLCESLASEAKRYYNFPFNIYFDCLHSTGRLVLYTYSPTLSIPASKVLQKPLEILINQMRSGWHKHRLPKDYKYPGSLHPPGYFMVTKKNPRPYEAEVINLCIKRFKLYEGALALVTLFDNEAVHIHYPYFVPYKVELTYAYKHFDPPPPLHGTISTLILWGKPKDLIPIINLLRLKVT